MLDQALLRPGRFDRQVTVDRPDVQGRVKVLKVHSRGKSIGKDVDFDKVARRTPGEQQVLLLCCQLKCRFSQQSGFRQLGSSQHLKETDPCCSLPAGFTGADLQNLMNEAAILAARRNLKEISKEEISDALERLIAGPEKKGAVVAEKKRKLVAYHEVRTG